jgi:HD-GYP domain-containing protein (c-di-GMP phosphodiesterase class II)
MSGFYVEGKNSSLEKISQNSATLELLARGDGAEVLLQEIDADKIIQIASPDRESTMEFFYILEGSITWMKKDGEHVVLSAGDYFYINYFRGKEHLKTREITKLLYVSTEPIFHHISEVIKDFMAMINQVEDKDYYTHSHGRRVQEYASKIASKMDIIGDRFERLMYAALFHDIGKIKLDDTIINGTEAPTNDEWGEIHKHPIYGREIIERSLLRSIGEIVEQHHERLDGSGYPHGIKGDSILLEARIIAVIDAFDAMTTDRSYAKAMSIQEAVKELTNDAGTKFDSEVVKYFVEVLIEEGLLSD